MSSAFKIGFRTVRVTIFSILLILIGGTVGFRLGRGQNVPLVSKVAEKIPYISQLSRVQQTPPPPDFSQVDFTQFWEVWRRLERDYVDPEKLDAKKMVYGAIQGMTSAVGDPYTVYLPPEEQKRSTEDLQGSFEGVGIQLGYKNNTLVVMAPLKGLPADRAGILAGDYILKIKDEKKSVSKDTAGISLPEAVSLIRGEKGTTVTLTMLREGGQPEDKALIRDTIIVPSVELTYVGEGEKKVAHLTLSRFGDRTDAEWNSAVQDIASRGKNVKGVVLDLRNNPGGYLQGAIDIASEFIKDGVVVTQQGKSSKQDFTVSRRGKLTDTPVVVLVNKGSASASEIVAGALHDRRKSKLIGENTFGKGTVQDAQSDLPNGAGLHVTVAKWLLPSGNWIHEQGIPVDIEATDDVSTSDKDEALEKAIETL